MSETWPVKPEVQAWPPVFEYTCVSRISTLIGLPDIIMRDRFWKPMSYIAPSPPIADHRRAQMEFFVGELLPVEVVKKSACFSRLIAAVQLDFGHADGLEAFGHLRHVAFEDAHRHRGRILEQVVGPRERIRIERIGRRPTPNVQPVELHDSHAAAAALV